MYGSAVRNDCNCPPWRDGIQNNNELVNIWIVEEIGHHGGFDFRVPRDVDEVSCFGTILVPAPKILPLRRWKKDRNLVRGFCRYW
jgi:hypothetical protein